MSTHAATVARISRQLGWVSIVAIVAGAALSVAMDSAALLTFTAIGFIGLLASRYLTARYE